MMKTISTAALPLLGALLLVGCTSQQVCQRNYECADKPGDDYIAVCQAVYDGSLNALRANKEDECHLVAEMKERFDACSAQLDSCRERERIGSRNYDGECEDEHDDYLDALSDAGLECGTLD